VAIAWTGRPDPRRPRPVGRRSSAGADELLAHWRSVGDEAQPAQIDWQTAEFAVHTWDLAQATGWTEPLDPVVAERGLAFMTNALTPDNRGQAFGPEQAAPADAGAYERIAAFAGRPIT
jgi:hypothetical protein